jgi:hypothetical protein
VEIEPQNLTSCERSGFTVVEWGGAQISVPTITQDSKSENDIELYTIIGRYCISTNGRVVLLSKDNGAICITPANNDDIFNELENGDEIEITISGIEETYPAQAYAYPKRHSK